MRWPWSRKASGDLLVVSWAGQTLAYVLARALQDGTHQVLKLGVEQQGSDSTEDFVRRLQGLGLKGHETRVMLRPQQYQLLQIEAPTVPPEELRAAARYQIKEMIQSHVDDVTLDVMRVGDGSQKGAGHLFVVAAPNTVVRAAIELGDAMHWAISVIDIQETAQRNLQSAVAAREGVADRANAALVIMKGHQAVLTISANEELFYSRWFELPDDFLAAPWGGGDASIGFADSTSSAVEEEAPDYSVGGVSYGSDYSDKPGDSLSFATGSAVSAGDDDKTQRLLVEVQRSLDVWDRSWSSMPLDCLRVYAGERSDELAKWLGTQLGLATKALDVREFFPGFDAAAAQDQARCLPLLGVLMRTESRKL